MQTYHSPVTAAERKAGNGDSKLRVVCFSTYVNDRKNQSPRHRDARNFLLALRGEPVEGVSKVPVANEERTLDSGNSNDSIDWFGEMATAYLASIGVRPPFTIVPVPTPQTTLESSSGPWTSLLAISVASNILGDIQVMDVLRWKRPWVPGQTYTAADLYENLAATSKINPDVPVVLVDHVFSTSARLQACAARLQQQGLRVLFALCAGRTATEAEHDPFMIVTGRLPELAPGH